MKKIILLLCVCFVASALSANANERLICEIMNASTLNNVQINSTQNVSDLTLYRAIYKEKQLKEIKSQSISLIMGKNTFIFEETATEGDAVQFFCWNKNLCPQSNAFVKQLKSNYTVTFKDWDNSDISIQNVARRGSASLPVSPLRKGYIFSGWEGNYKNINDDTILTAKYVIPTADNIFAISSASGNVGNEISVNISLTGAVKTCGFDMKLIYDTNALEYVKHETGTALDVNAGYNALENSIRFNFSANKNRTKLANIMTVTFKLKEVAKTGTAIKLEPVETLAVDADYNVFFIFPDIFPRADVGINFVDGMVFAE